MTHKAKLTIIAILSCCAIFSMGFATWVITQDPVVEELTGSIGADSVIYSNDYVYLDPDVEDGIENITYGRNYFIKETLTLNLLVNVDKCKGYNAESIVISIRYLPEPKEDYNMFAHYNSDFITATAVIDNNDSPLSLVSNIDDNENKLNSTLTFGNFDELNGTVKLSVTFTFNLSGSNYKTYIYNAFHNSECEFAFDIRVQGA